MNIQATLNHACSFQGVGLHNGQPCQVIVHPAPAHHGVVFLKDGVTIPALASSVVSTAFCVKIGKNGVSIQTIEHLLCALLMNHVSNALCEVIGDEIPILDGSARLFSQRFLEVGLCAQQAPRKVAKVLHPVSVTIGDASAEMFPSPYCSIDVTLDYNHKALASSSLQRSFRPFIDPYPALIDSARTYGFLKDQPFYQKHGLAQGANIHSALIFNDSSVENPEGMRFPDEITRHKILDCIGDLSLLGAPFIGLYKATRPGHALNVAIVRALFDQNAIAWEDLPSHLSSVTAPLDLP